MGSLNLSFRNKEWNCHKVLIFCLILLFLTLTNRSNTLFFLRFTPLNGANKYRPWLKGTVRKLVISEDFTMINRTNGSLSLKICWTSAFIWMHNAQTNFQNTSIWWTEWGSIRKLSRTMSTPWTNPWKLHSWADSLLSLRSSKIVTYFLTWGQTHPVLLMGLSFRK